MQGILSGLVTVVTIVSVGYFAIGFGLVCWNNLTAKKEADGLVTQFQVLVDELQEKSEAIKCETTITAETTAITDTHAIEADGCHSANLNGTLNETRDLRGATRDQLRELARDLRVPQWWKMTKAQLLVAVS